MEINDFIKDIQKSENVRKHCDLIDHYLVYNSDIILDIFSKIPKDWDFLLKNWQLRALYEKIIKATCFSLGKRYILLASSLYLKIERKLDKYRIGSYLASCQNPNEIIENLLDIEDKQLLLLVLHELISRGISLSDNKNISLLIDLNNKSEFKKLELYPLPQEMSNSFPSYTRDSSSSSLSFGFSDDDIYQQIEKVADIRLSFSQNIQLENGLSHWTDQSGGIVIGYNGQTRGIVTDIDIITNIPEFTESKRIRLKELNTRNAFCRIFDAISKGAAYSSGEYGGVGRLKTWSTIGQLIGLSDFNTNSEVSVLMEAYKWYEFNTDSWFINEWCDFGIFCRNKDTGQFGLLAGTDTD
ncbi:MAG: DUF6183 family protein [Bacteroidales bacterium]|nr:DUF6183 family protein [Bacteroidales bacterium]